MKTFRSTGPFPERPYWEDAEFELLAEEELRGVDLYPKSPSPVRIERFVETRFGVTPEYSELPNSVLGFTAFGKWGVEGVVVSRRLSEERRTVAERRINTTLAHEAGHGLLHAHLFALHKFNHSLFGGHQDAEPGKVLCRDDGVQGAVDGGSNYDGRWWEYQANRLMGALLLPRALVQEVVNPLLESEGSLGVPALPESAREGAARRLSDVFEVNPIVGRIRLQQLYPSEDGAQLTL